MPRPLRTRPVSIVQVRAYTGKAREYTTQEYADVAVVEIAAGRDIAATSLAIHAAINAVDAVCGALLGELPLMTAASSHRW